MLSLEMFKYNALYPGLCKKLGNLVSVSAPEYQYVSRTLYRTEEATELDVKQVATNIQQRKIEVSASLSVVYEIK
jgi:uncharacterized protein YggE